MAMYERAGKSNNWHTPNFVFRALKEEFDLDVAAPERGPRYVPCKKWFFKDGLAQIWHGFVWMNPPFGHQLNKMAWLEKFFEHGNGIALLPDRTSAPWWQRYAPLASAVLFVTPKIKFERDDGSLGENPGTGTVLFASGDRARSALKQAGELGVIFIPMEGF